MESRIEKKRKIQANRKDARSAKTMDAGVLMRVFINNRLGARTEVLCSPSDTIGAFKKVAAVYLGIRSETMVLKRQGERPSKDFIMLDDYGIGNGSSLDLKINACD